MIKPNLTLTLIPLLVRDDPVEVLSNGWGMLKPQSTRCAERQALWSVKSRCYAPISNAFAAKPRKPPARNCREAAQPQTLARAQ